MNASSDMKKTLTKLADMLANAVVPNHDASEMQAEVFKTSDTASVAKIRFGKAQAIAKVFRDTADGQAAFARERKALQLLHGDLVQQLVFVSEPDLVLVTRYIDGKPLSEVVTKETLIQMAEFLGQWFGRLANIAPHSPADTNWADYLAQYQSGFNPDLLIQQDMTLGQVPISRLILSHNDNALGNFILGADKHLYAVDFEDSRMKPEGWELVTAANALFRRFPDDLPSISASLFRGYQLTAKDHGLKPGFDQVIGLAVIACFTDGAFERP